jgi:gamma-glutamyl-gamma-aminobutyrate hydrolase PuuD
MKRILLTQRLVKVQGTGEERDCLDVNWARLLSALDMVPVPFPVRYSPTRFTAELPCDALILTGGGDLSSVTPDPLSARRDAAERELLEIFLDRRLPVLGVCRGMQLVGEAFGMGLTKVDGHVAVRHGLEVSRASAVARSLETLHDVNSYHDYAISDVKAPFVVTARAPDGVVEAMECRERGIFCQMWHSERESTFPPGQLEILREVLHSWGGGIA